MIYGDLDIRPYNICINHSYKQNKFNLSREETLGFSKLVGEIITNAFQADEKQNKDDNTAYDDLIQVVLRNISSLIGMSGNVHTVKSLSLY